MKLDRGSVKYGPVDDDWTAELEIRRPDRFAIVPSSL
jgi:hypothetical protein